jgi:hypothetical protein
MGSNRHDGWLRFCGTHEELLAATGIPAAITHGEYRFRDLIRDGKAVGCGTSASLSALSQPQWLAFEKFVEVFFAEFESCAPLELFPSFRREAEHRGRAWFVSGRPPKEIVDLP